MKQTHALIVCANSALIIKVIFKEYYKVFFKLKDYQSVK